MKIAFLGGGALRLLGTVDALLTAEYAPRELTLVFQDLDLGRAETVATLVRKMPSAEGRRVETRGTTDLEGALEGADYVYSCMRVGGVEALERDQRLGAKWGYHGHDDFGPSGIMLTVRTVPVILHVAERMAERCPQAWFLVFTNPVPTLLDALHRYTDRRAIGLCSGVYNFAWDMDHLFGIGVPSPELRYRGAGLNHLSWVTKDATYQGRLVTEMIEEAWQELPTRPGAARCNWEMGAKLFELYGQLVMNNGHQHHYFFHDRWAREMRERFERTAAEEQRSARQSGAAAQAAELARQERIDNFWGQPALADSAASAAGDLGAQVILALQREEPEELAVTYPNAGHAVGMPEGHPAEAHALVSRAGVAPLGVDAVPRALWGLYHAIAEHQRLTVDAVVKRDRKLLAQAFVAEPTIRSWERAQPMFEELWAAAVAAGEVDW